MTEELEVYISILEEKDKNNERYFLNVLGEKDSPSGVVTLPLLSMKQLRNKATGSERFANCVQQAYGKNLKSIVVEEYSNCSDNATPICVNTFELNPTTPKKRNKKNKVMNDANTLGKLNDIFDAMGVEGGLNGFMKSTAQAMSIADRYDDAKATIADQKSELKDKDNEIKSLKKDIEKLKSDLRDEKDKSRDIEHDCERKINDLQQQYGMLGTLGNFAGAFMANTSLGQKFAGFLSGTNAPTPTPQTQAQTSQTQDQSTIVEVDPLMAQWYSNIDEYYKSLDQKELEMFCTIVDFCSRDTNNVRKIAAICKKLYQKQQQDGSVSENLDD